jgi:hypothetical protein
MNEPSPFLTKRARAIEGRRSICERGVVHADGDEHSDRPHESLPNMTVASVRPRGLRFLANVATFMGMNRVVQLVRTDAIS